jgi:site-specific DNA-methyltransferase (adenine-specific)
VKTAWEVRQGDALTELESIPPDSVSAYITDPPYCSGGFSETARRQAKSQGIKKPARWFAADNMGTAGIAWLLRGVAWQAERTLIQGGSFMVFTDWRQVSNLAPVIESAGLRYTNMVVWDKGSFAQGAGFRPRHEIILHFTNGPGVYYDTRTASVLRVPRVPSHRREHQTEKPMDLLRALVRVVTPVDGLVVDAFAGSGSTGEASLIEKRRFLGIERDPDFCAVARRRLAAADGLRELPL